MATDAALLQLFKLFAADGAFGSKNQAELRKYLGHLCNSVCNAGGEIDPDLVANLGEVFRGNLNYDWCFASNIVFWFIKFGMVFRAREIIEVLAVDGGADFALCETERPVPGLQDVKKVTVNQLGLGATLTQICEYFLPSYSLAFDRTKLVCFLEMHQKFKLDTPQMILETAFPVSDAKLSDEAIRLDELLTLDLFKNALNITTEQPFVLSTNRTASEEIKDGFPKFVRRNFFKTDFLKLNDCPVHRRQWGSFILRKFFSAQGNHLKQDLNSSVANAVKTKRAEYSFSMILYSLIVLIGDMTLMESLNEQCGIAINNKFAAALADMEPLIYENGVRIISDPLSAAMVTQHKGFFEYLLSNVKRNKNLKTKLVKKANLVGNMMKMENISELEQFVLGFF